MTLSAVEKETVLLPDGSNAQPVKFTVTRPAKPAEPTGNQAKPAVRASIHASCKSNARLLPQILRP